MGPFAIAPIVEGHGDVLAVRVLLHVLRPELQVCRPIRIHRSRIADSQYMRQYFGIADANIKDAGNLGGVLVLADSDDDCPAELGPRLLGMAGDIIGHRQTEVVLAKRMFEAWIIGGRAAGMLQADDPEAIANPKGRLKTHLGNHSETVDQPSLTSRINPVAAAASCPSSAKLDRALDAFRPTNET